MRPPATAPSTREREEGEDNQAATGVDRTGPTADPRTQMKRARVELREQQRRRERMIARERERVTARLHRNWPGPNPAHTWVRNPPAPRRTAPALLPTLEGMQIEMEVDTRTGGADVNLSLEEITMVRGDHDHLLRGKARTSTSTGPKW